MRARPVALALTSALTLSACGPALTDLPRPGGSVSGPSYQLTAEFADALNLPDGAHVRVDGVEVGRVTHISTANFVARVELRLPTKVLLTDQATAELRLTTPLGEGFIAIDPGHGARTLHPGDVIPAAATSTAASVEDMLSAASVLLTGGGLAQLRTIVVELNKVLSGKSGNTPSLLRSMNDALGALNARTADIDRTLAALDSLSATLVKRRDTIRAALTDTVPAARLLADQTDKFADLLVRVAALGKAGDKVVRATRADLISTLKSAEPVLDALISISKQVGPTLEQLIKFGKFLDSAVPGDYLTGDAEFNNNSIGFGTGPDVGPDLSLRQMWQDRR
jgi:phospholipid/cholesterol/gamma-HCH transport system substrate-binding protein